jgi:hypothetical protein
MTRGHWTTWPTRDRHSPYGYTYVIEFSSGAVKVGHTTNPAARANSLRVDAARFGLTIIRAWLSAPHGNHAVNEKAMIGEGRRIGTQLASEYFDCSFHDLVAFASALPQQQHAGVPGAVSPGAVRIAKRRQQARELRDSGRSYREISDALGISVASAHNYCRD